MTNEDHGGSLDMHVDEQRDQACEHDRPDEPAREADQRCQQRCNGEPRCQDQQDFRREV